MSKFADLHMHTHFSDGMSSPEELVQDALKAGLSCIAVTDHDTVAGIAPTMAAAKEHGLEVLSGVELSTELNGRDVHMLAYCFDLKDAKFTSVINEAQNYRVVRMRKMIEKLNALGIEDITFEDVNKHAQSKSIGRPHLAQVLVEKKHVGDIKQAFDKYIAEGAPAYVSKCRLTPQEAIEIVHQAGGVTVLAHPMVTKIDEMIPQLVRMGLDGMEVYYPNTSQGIIDFYLNLAKKHQLLVTGGSDAHGSVKPNTYVGKAKIEYGLVEQLKQKARAV